MLPKWQPLVLTLGIASVSFVSASAAYAMSTTLPVAAAELGSKNAYGWGMAMFFSGSTLGVCIAGTLAPRVRPAHIQGFGLILFASGLLYAATADSGFALVVARAIQGVGSGIEVVSVYVLIARCYPPAQRPRMVALTSMALVLPGMVGPAVAGWVSTEYDWRLVFIGLGLAVLLASALTVIPSRHLAAQEKAGERRFLVGGVAAVAGLTLLQFGGLFSWQFSLPLMPPALGMVYIAFRAFMPPGTLALVPGAPAFTGMRALLSASYFGGQIWIPSMLLELHHMSPVRAGLTLIGAPLGWALGATWQGRIGVDAKTMPARRRHVALGATCAGLGMLAMLVSVMTPVPLAVLILLWTIAATGSGLAAASVTVLLLNTARTNNAGSIGSSLHLADTLASGTSIAIGTVIYQIQPFTSDHTGAYGLIFAGCTGLCIIAAFSSTASSIRTPEPDRKDQHADHDARTDVCHIRRCR